MAKVTGGERDSKSKAFGIIVANVIKCHCNYLPTCFWRLLMLNRTFELMEMNIQNYLNACGYLFSCSKDLNVDWEDN